MGGPGSGRGPKRRKNLSDIELLRWMLDRAERDSATGCLLWRGTLNRLCGYGQMSFRRGRSETAHRVLWQLCKGDIPRKPRMCVCHHCDTPLCIELDHMFLGTHRDNMADMRRKHRTRSALTPAELDLMKALYAGGFEPLYIAQRLGVVPNTVYVKLRQAGSGVLPPRGS